MPTTTSAAAVAAEATSPGTYSRTALVLLVLANVVPLLGVVYFGWDLFSIMLLYWIENLIVGLFNIPRILMAGTWGGHAPVEAQVHRYIEHAGRLFVAAFFALHYGGFWFAHGMFVLRFFGKAQMHDRNLLSGAAEAVSNHGLWLPIAALMISHGASFVFNYIGRGEFRTATPQEQMNQPYSRVIVLHLTIIFGAFLTIALGSPVAALALMVVIKTVVDIKAHLKEHRKSPGNPAPKPEVAAA